MRINRLIAAAGAVAGLAVLTATSASATAGQSQAAPAASQVGAVTGLSSAAASVRADQPKDGGKVAIPAGEGKVSVKKTVNVGGGTWSYGTRVGTAGFKHCYSNYTHPKKKHSSTAIMADVSSKDYASKGHWSKAGVTGGWIYTCYAYWNTY